MENKWLVIVNPNSGRKKGKKDWPKIEALLTEAGFEFEVLFTEQKYHAIELARQGVERGYRQIIAAGGDGTLNEVVNGVFQQTVCATTDVVLGMITIGTGNDWGRMYNIPTAYDKAIEVIKTKKTFIQDAGLVEYTCEDDNQRKSRYFVNMAGMGFDAQVAKKTNKQKEQGKGNRFSYLINLATTLWMHKYKNSEITIGHHTFKSKIFTMAVAICKYNGGGMMQSPAAIPDDGILNMTVIKNMGKLKVIRNMAKLYDGSFIQLPEVNTFEGTDIKISSPQSFFLEADGESLGYSPFYYSIKKQCVKLVINV